MLYGDFLRMIMVALICLQNFQLHAVSAGDGSKVSTLFHFYDKYIDVLRIHLILLCFVMLKHIKAFTAGLIDCWNSGQGCSTPLSLHLVY